MLETPNDSCLLGLESEVKMMFRNWILDDFGYYASVHHSKEKSGGIPFVSTPACHDSLRVL